jgi:hypothetical protein
MSTVTVNIKDGKVFRIDDIPTDLVVIVRSYDVGETPEEKLSKDENGKSCEVYEHHSAE